MKIKISGLAAYIKRNSALCQGTLLIDADLRTLSEVLCCVLHPVTNIKRYLGDNCSLFHVKESILYGFKRLYGINFYFDNLSEYEEKISKMLRANKYCRESWNLRDIPQQSQQD